MTVKPIRQKLEESKSSLKETLKVGIQASELRSLQTQAAGHGSEVTFVLSTRRRLIVGAFSEYFPFIKVRMSLFKNPA